MGHGEAAQCGPLRHRQWAFADEQTALARDWIPVLADSVDDRPVSLALGR